MDGRLAGGLDDVKELVAVGPDRRADVIVDARREQQHQRQPDDEAHADNRPAHRVFAYLDSISATGNVSNRSAARTVTRSSSRCTGTHRSVMTLWYESAAGVGRDRTVSPQTRSPSGVPSTSGTRAASSRGATTIASCPA